MTDWIRCESCGKWVDASETLCVNCLATLPRSANDPLSPLARDFAIVDILKRRRNGRIQSILLLAWFAAALCSSETLLYYPLEHAHLLASELPGIQYEDFTYYLWELTLTVVTFLILEKGGHTPSRYVSWFGAFFGGVGLFCWGKPRWYKHVGNFVGYAVFIAIFLLGWMRPVLIRRIKHPVEPMYPPTDAHTVAQLITLIDHEILGYAALALLAMALVAICHCFNPVANVAFKTPPTRHWNYAGNPANQSFDESSSTFKKLSQKGQYHD